MKINIKILDDQAICPKYAYPGDAGFDICSINDINLKPNQRTIIHCGFSIEIPKGYAGFVIPRSGLAAKYGITIVNSPGLIDSGYRGEICVIVLNTGTKDFHINVGDRIAQMMIVPFLSAELNPVKNLSDTQRAENRFGSSGINTQV